MANHCTDIICLDCGREWCSRGCSYSAGPSQERIAQRAQRRAAWSQRYGRAFPDHPAKETCDCGSQRTVIS